MMLRNSVHQLLFHCFLLLLAHFASSQNGSITFSSSSETLSGSATFHRYFERRSGRRRGELRHDQNSLHSHSVEIESVVTKNSTSAPNSINSSVEDPEDLLMYPTLPQPIFRPIFTSITQEDRNTHSYSFNASVLSRWSAFQLQFYAETDERQEDSGEISNNPLVVTAFWWGSISSWKIPVTFINDTSHASVNRYSENMVGKTIWQYNQNRRSHKFGNLTVEVSSFNEVKVYYKFRIIPLKDFIVPSSLSITGTATPSSPAFFKFAIPKDCEYVFIHAVSESDACAKMSVEKLRGPFLDMEENSPKVQVLETFTRKAGITIKTEALSKGLLLSFTPFSNDFKCITNSMNNALSNNSDDEFRPKVITFQIRPGPSSVTFIKPVSFPLLVFFVVTLFVFILMVFSYNIRHNTLNKGEHSIIERCLYQYTSNITINDLIVTEPSRVVDQSRRYCSAGFVTSAFYTVPVFQLIFTFSRQLIETGNFDLCYFNHFCSHMLFMFHDFNHMYSNIWYVLFGLLYMLMVRIRQVTFDPDYANIAATLKKSKVFLFFHRADGRMDRGAMTHYGLLYCLGYALIMTGVMSTAYHICPNQRNFQFDTVFMYTIAAITVVTLYQSRHPTYLSANFTFTALALVTIITVVGLLWTEFYVRVVFSVVHMLFLVFSLPKVFYSGYIRKNNRLVVHWREVMKILCRKVKDDLKNRRIFKIQREKWHDPNNFDIIIIPGPGRIILPGFLFVINCFSIAAMWTVLLEQNFATQVLFICVTNGALYTVFYSALKLFHGECRRVLWLQPCIYLLLSFALWGTAMFFFFDEVSTWESSPAESRLKNTDCIVLSFYDSHDMWHFLSAAALFFSAMVLLTVDDDLVDQPKSTIPVF